jgi:hypothetical protein
MAKRTEVQPIILLRVKMAAIGRVEDMVPAGSVISCSSDALTVV